MSKIFVGDVLVSPDNTAYIVGSCNGSPFIYYKNRITLVTDIPKEELQQCKILKGGAYVPTSEGSKEKSDHG